ncbi:MAG TPA: DMT family transporter [Burkholderiaceae bacterium]|nr:DMT family transporter [Burkholderiaceae bacterium]
MTESAAVSGQASGLRASTVALLLLPPMLWAGNAIVGRLLVGSFPPIALNLARWTIALVILLPLLAWRYTHLSREGWSASARWMVWIGLLGVGAYNALQYLALQTSSPVNTTLIGASGPVITLALGAWLFKVPVRSRQWLGATVSIVGVLVVLTRGDIHRLAALGFVRGDLYMLLATASWSLYTWLLRRHRPNLPNIEFMALQIVWGCAWVAPVAALELTVGGGHIAWSWKVAAALAYIALGPSLVAYVCWDRGVAHTGATVPVFFANLTPLFAAVLSALVLGEAPHAYHAAAFVLIVVGIVLSLPPRR